MSVERSGQAIDVETLKGQLVTGGARGFNGGRQLSTDGTSRMNREVQVRICEGLGVKFPGPTRHRGAAAQRAKLGSGDGPGHRGVGGQAFAAQRVGKAVQ